MRLIDALTNARAQPMLRDSRKGEDIRSVMRKLERLTEAGLCTARRQGDGGWFTITDSGREALLGERGRVAIDAMAERYAERQKRWNAEAERDRRRLSEEIDPRERD